MVDVIPLATVSLLSTVIGTILALVRLYFRWIKLQIWRWDDFFLFAALATAIGGYVVVAWMTFTSLLHAQNDPKFRKLAVYRYYWKFLAQNEAAMAVYTLQAMFARLSLIYSYRGFCPYGRFRTQRRAVNITGIFAVIIGMLFTYGTLFPCSPPKFMRYPNTWINEHTTYCLGPREVFWWSFTFNAICDAAVWSLAFWLLRKYKEELQEKYQRVGLVGLYALGGLTVFVGLMRIPILWPMRMHDAGIGGVQNVSLYRQMGSWMLTAVHANLYLVAASIPTLRRIVPAFRPEVTESFSEHLPNINTSQSAGIGRESGQEFINLGRDFEDDSFRQSGRAEMQQRRMHLTKANANGEGSVGTSKYNSYGSRASRNTSGANSLSGKSGNASHFDQDEYDIFDRTKNESPDAKENCSDLVRNGQHAYS